MIKNLSDTIYRNFNFKLQLLMFIDNKGEKAETIEKFGNKKIASISESRNLNEYPSVYFDTYSKALIGFCAMMKSEDGTYNSLGDHIYFSQKSFYEIEIAINICTEWLRSKSYKHLFDVNSDGVIVGLGSPAPYNPSVYKNQSEFIRFFPAVVRDFNGIKYEGISIKSHKGALAQFTCSEFLALSFSLKSYLSNMYGNNIMLYNTAVNLIRIKAIKDHQRNLLQEKN